MTEDPSIALYNAVTSDTGHLFSSYQRKLMEKGTFSWPGQTLKQVYAASLQQSLLKKFLPDAKSLDLPNSRALELFLSINESCASFTLAPDRLSTELILGEMKNIIYRFWFRSHWTSGLEGHPFDSLDRGRMGPGASVGALGTDFYTKLFSSPLTCTSEELKVYFQHYHSKSPSWTEAERLRKSIFGAPVVVNGNRLAFVPKNNEVSRVICVEPSLNMFFQLGFGRLLEERLRSVFRLDLSTQPEYNRELARIGSLSGRYSTIDLSSASDSMSLVMLREMLPASFFDCLKRYRSPTCDLPGGSQIPLEMVSTMGNGFTFPLQTMLFASCVAAVYKLLGLHFVCGPNGTAGVFGDDIVCLTEASRFVIDTLSVLGFKTNSNKTFLEGFFRESCGHDYHLGSNVRGVYVKSLSTDIARYVTFNLLNSFSARSGISLPSAVKFLAKDIRFLPVPEWENNDAGMRLPLFLLGKMKYDRNNSYIYYKNFPKVRYLVFGDAEVRQPRMEKRRPRIYNPEGALISFLVGGIVRGRISLRTSDTRYGRRRAVAPSWEMTASDAAKAGVLTGRWRTACATNFGW